MNAEEVWYVFCAENHIDTATPYEAWAFCGGGPDADELAALVLAGIKFGTASAYDDYLLEDALDELPKAGDYSVILDQHDEALCVLKTRNVQIVPFNQVSQFHSYSEGEAGRTLDDWREIHRRIFGPGLEGTAHPLTGKSLMVLEKFTVEYVADTPTVERLLKTVDQRPVTPGELDQSLYFVEPTHGMEAAIAEYRNEMLDAGSSMDGSCQLWKTEDISGWIDKAAGWGNPERVLGPDELSGTELLCLRKSDDRIVGTIEIHHNENSAVTNYAGHIGYSVRPSERQKGYGTWMLGHVLDYCRCLGIQKAGISCRKANTGSMKIILKNGGVYRDSVPHPKFDCELDRYWI